MGVEKLFRDVGRQSLCPTSLDAAGCPLMEGDEVFQTMLNNSSNARDSLFWELNGCGNLQVLPRMYVVKGVSISGLVDLQGTVKGTSFTIQDITSTMVKKKREYAPDMKVMFDLRQISAAIYDHDRYGNFLKELSEVWEVVKETDGYVYVRTETGNYQTLVQQQLLMHPEAERERSGYKRKVLEHIKKVRSSSAQA